MTKRINTVHIRVADLEAQTRFYQQIIGLTVHRQDEHTVFLGAGGDDLLALIHTPNGVAARGQNGLYHFALLLPTRIHLAQALQHLLQSQTPLQGMSDHIVSEAIYLADPEGNGIELYADRPRSHWYHNGQFQMGTLPLDIDDLLGTASPDKHRPYALPTGTIMGHIHLHVNAIAEAIAFYRDILGMALMLQIPSAAFLSYDGYHHHIGINTWAGQVSHTANRLGLDHFRLVMDKTRSETLSSRNPAIASQPDWTLIDPSANTIHIDVTN